MQRPICPVCGIRPRRLSWTQKETGKSYFKKTCKTCHKHPNLGDKAKLTTCRGCGKEYHPVQLDVDHIDGNHQNDKYENLQILCANCHRLKSHLCKDSVNKEYR